MQNLKDLFMNIVPVETRAFKRGDHVFSQGSPAHHIFRVAEGQVKLERFTIEGRSVLMHVSDDGESFAEAALFSDVYHCNAIAVVPSRVDFYPKDQVLDIIGSDTEKAKRLIAYLAHQVRNLRTRLELRNILSARERVFRYLLLNVSPINSEVTISIPLKQLAIELGLAHETFYRELAALEKDGVIQRNEKRIKILNASLI